MNVRRYLVPGLFGILALLTGPARPMAATGSGTIPSVSDGEVALTPDPQPDEGSSHLEWSATYASWYSFQGFDYSNRRPVLQPELSFILGRLSLGLWGNLDQSSGEVNEADVTLRWAWESGSLSGALGAVSLDYPNRPDWEPSQELLADAAYEGPVDASVSLHWDVDEGHGRYWALRIGREFPVRGVATTLATTAYAQEHYYGLSGVSAVETRVGVRRVWAGVVWEPSVARIWSWENGDLFGEEAVTPGWLVGVTLSPP